MGKAVSKFIGGATKSIFKAVGLYDDSAEKAAKEAADRAASMQAEANRIAGETAAQQQKLQQAQIAAIQNQQVDLKTSEVSQVVPGGEASTADLKRKKKVGLSTTLGVNV